MSAPLRARRPTLTTPTTPPHMPSSPTPLLARRLPWLLLLIVIAIAYYGSYVRYGINFHDDGATFALDAKRLLAGELPFKDVELGYNVLWFYPAVGLFKLFGVNFVLLRGYCFALSVLTAVLAFLTLERVSRQAWLAFLVALVLVLVPGMTFKNYMPLLAVANIYCLVHWALGARPQRVQVATEEGTTEEYLDVPCAPSWGWLIAGAFVLGLTFLIRIDVGTFFLLLWLGGEWLLALRPLASPGARAALLIGGPLVTIIIATAVHIPVYLDAVKRGFDKPFVARYEAWPADLVASLEERLRAAPAGTLALPAPAEDKAESGDQAVTPAPAFASPAVTPASADAVTIPPAVKPDAPVVPPVTAVDPALPKITPAPPASVVPPAAPIPVPTDLDGLPKPAPAPSPDAPVPAAPPTTTPSATPTTPPPPIPDAPKAAPQPEPATPPPCKVPGEPVPAAPAATEPNAPAASPAKDPATPTAPATEAPAAPAGPAAPTTPISPLPAVPAPVPAASAPATETPAPSAPAPSLVAFKSINGNPQKPETLEFQINTTAIGKGSVFLKLGDTLGGTKFKLEKFEAKLGTSPSGTEADVSELTLINTETGASLVVVLGKSTEIPADLPPSSAPATPTTPATPTAPATPTVPATLASDAPTPAAPAAPTVPAPPASDATPTAPSAASPTVVRPEKDANWNTHGLRPKTLADLKTATNDQERALILLRYIPLFILVPLALWAFFATLTAWRSNALGAMNRPVAALLVIGGALTIFPQYFFWRSDSPHISEFMPGYWVAAFAAAILLGWSDLRRTSWVARTFAVLFLLALAAHASLYLWRMLPDRWTGTIAAWGTFQRHGHGPWHWKARNDTLFHGANGVDVYVGSKEYPALEELKTLVNSHSSSPNDYLIAYPYHPQINLLCDRRTYEKNVYVDNATCGRGWNEAAIARIQQNRPNVIVLSDWAINGTEDSRFSVWAEKTKTWIQTNYLLQTKLLEFEVYTRPEKEQ